MDDEENGEDAAEDPEAQAEEGEGQDKESQRFATAALKYANSKYYKPFIQYFPERGDKNHCIVHPPTSAKVVQELKAINKSKIINIYPVAPSDMGRAEIVTEIEKCFHFSIHYYKSSELKWTGCLKLLYSQQSDAEEAKRNLTIAEGITVKGDFTLSDKTAMEKAINKPSYSKDSGKVISIQC